MTADRVRGERIGPKRAGERRWPMAAAVVVVGLLHATLPDDFLILPGWVYQVLLLVFLAILVIGDPGRIDRQTTWLRITTDLLIALITAATLFSAVHLVWGIVDGGRFADAKELLLIGGVVWLTNVIAFALWFWDLDGGGAAARASGSSTRTRAFLFPEMSDSEHVDKGWFPQFFDYLALSYNTAMAFSPTDVVAVKIWAKLLMMAESAVSLVVSLLVIARAINILPS
jgi:uncharacterized membrane protein